MIFCGDSLHSPGKKAVVLSLPRSRNEEDEVKYADIKHPFATFAASFAKKLPKRTLRHTYLQPFRLALREAFVLVEGHDLGHVVRSKVAGWWKLVHEGSGEFYYWHEETGDVQWDSPALV
jgi:hypothetical protein